MPKHRALRLLSLYVPLLNSISPCTSRACSTTARELRLCQYYVELQSPSSAASMLHLTVSSHNTAFFFCRDSLSHLSAVSLSLSKRCLRTSRDKALRLIRRLARASSLHGSYMSLICSTPAGGLSLLLMLFTDRTHCDYQAHQAV